MDPVIKSFSDSDTESAGSARLYQVHYTPDIAGQYAIRVQYGGHPVTGSPFNVTVNPVGMATNVNILSQFCSSV